MILNIKYAFSVVALVFFLSPPALAANLITNGNFETLTNGSGQLGYNTEATGWTATTYPASSPAFGYSFAYTPGVADTSTGAPGEYGDLAIWGNGNGGANGFDGTAPGGGNIVAIDGDFQNAAISQTVSGLTVGNSYNLDFSWAASQQLGFSGATVQDMLVEFGGQSHTTSSYNLPSHGFSGWISESIRFTATNSSELLTFVAQGSQPVPPFALLADVSMASVPEPEMLALFGIGLLGMLAMSKQRNGLAA